MVTILQEQAVCLDGGFATWRNNAGLFPTEFCEWRCLKIVLYEKILHTATRMEH